MNQEQLVKGALIALIIIGVVVLIVALTVKAPKKSERYAARSNEDLDKCGIFTTTLAKLYPGICDQMFKYPDNQKCKAVTYNKPKTKDGVKDPNTRLVTNKLLDVFKGFGDWCVQSKPNEDMFFQYIQQN